MCGIGGRTIAEAKARIAYPEFMEWMIYRRRRGSFNAGMRIERGTSLIATILSNSNRGKNSTPVSFYDLAPYHDEPELSMEEAMERWK